MINFSNNMMSVEFALSINVNQKVYDARRKGEKVTVLSLGEAIFDIPLYDFNFLDQKKINRYCDTQGLPELREKIANYYSSQYCNLSTLNKDSVLISAGSKILIYLSMVAFLNPGDEVIIHEPAWLSYKDQAKIVGANIKFIPYNISVENFRNYITNKTKLVIVNNPNNPSGSVYTKNELSKIYDLCKVNKAYMLIDEAYSEFLEKKDFYSGLNLSANMDNLIVVNSLSKNMGISGWRIGYMISNQEVLRQILKLNQHTVTCAPSILQLYLAEYFDDIINYTRNQIKNVRYKRKEVAKIFKQHGFDLIPGSSTFYLMVDITPTGMISEEFANSLFEKYRISVVPGTAYGESVSNFIRVSVGSESLESITKAVEIMAEYVLCNKAA
jgi:aspartate aminotransferase/aminotransferase